MSLVPKFKLDRPFKSYKLFQEKINEGFFQKDTLLKYPILSQLVGLQKIKFPGTDTDKVVVKRNIWLNIRTLLPGRGIGKRRDVKYRA